MYLHVHAAYYSMKMNVVCILCIYNLCKQDVVYVEAQYPLDNYCSHYKAMIMFPTKMDSYIKIIGTTTTFLCKHCLLDNRKPLYHHQCYVQYACQNYLPKTKTRPVALPTSFLPCINKF